MKNLLWSLAAILTVSVSAPLASAVVVDYTTVADGTYASINLGGTTVTGSSSINVANFAGNRGLGITGGASSVSLDLGETMSFDLGSLASNVALTYVDIPTVGNVNSSFEAFNGATSLGVFNLPFSTFVSETFNLSAIAGGLDMTSFTVSVSIPTAPLGLMLQSVSFDAASVPDSGSSVALLGLSLIGLVVAGKRFRK